MGSSESVAAAAQALGLCNVLCWLPLIDNINIGHPSWHPLLDKVAHTSLQILIGQQCQEPKAALTCEIKLK